MDGTFHVTLFASTFDSDGRQNEVRICLKLGYLQSQTVNQTAQKYTILFCLKGVLA